MNASRVSWRVLSVAAGPSLLIVSAFLSAHLTAPAARAGWLWGHHHKAPTAGCNHPGHCAGMCDGVACDTGGTWYWLRSPEQERRVVMALYNRYCIRCHGIDGRGVWDIPDVPNFTNPAWQASRPENYRARVILEGRGAVMPPFRGTLTLEEACAMARYLYAFAPGMEVSRPELSEPAPAAAPVPVPVPAPASAPAPAPPALPSAVAPAPSPPTAGSLVR